MRKNTQRKRPVRRQQNNKVIRRVARSEAKKVVNRTIESKVFDGSTIPNSIDYTTGVILPLLVDPTGTPISQGTSDKQYIGTKINISYFMMRFQLLYGDPQNMVRVLIIQDIVSGIPTVANVFESVGNTRAPLSPFDRQFDKTYRVLYDKIFTLDNANNPQRVAKIKLGMRKFRPIEFNNAVGTIEKGAPYAVIISDSGILPNPAIQAWWRIHYKDA